MCMFLYILHFGRNLNFGQVYGVGLDESDMKKAQVELLIRYQF